MILILKKIRNKKNMWTDRWGAFFLINRYSKQILIVANTQKLNKLLFIHIYKKVIK